MLGKRRTLICLAIVASVTVTIGSGCASVDPTDPSHFNKVTIQNDTQDSVELIQCGSSCSELHDRTTLQSGGGTTVRVSHEGFTVSYLITSPSGKIVGCLYFHYDKPQADLRAFVSEAVRCEM